MLHKQSVFILYVQVVSWQDKVVKDVWFWV